jgi:2-polyprenyl-3-methyl-5-hydroxy-6-metoxy-1,4-benzoquinol methylase
LNHILDIGCGDGLLFDQLSRFGEVWGIEPDTKLVSPDNPWRSHIELAPFSPDYQTDRRFDLILMLDVLEHLPEDAKCLQRVFELLRPGGLCVVTVPALPSLWSRHDLINCHYRRYTLKTLQQLTDRAGLVRLEGHYFFGWTILPMYLRRLLHPAAATAASEDGDYDVQVPNRFVNNCLYGTCIVEQFFSAARGVPIGSSIFAVLQRPVGVLPVKETEQPVALSLVST